MGRKYGKKNVIKVDPLAYNLGLIGESGIGKTTLAKRVCEKLVGEDGYLIFNIGKEDGVDAIAGAMYEDVPDWATFDEVTKYIIANKNTEYKDLKVIVYDTYDQLVQIAEPEVIRLHNKENPDKKVKSIKAAFGGYMAGEDKATEIILDRMWELKRVGVSMFIIGHTKRRTMTDIITNSEYDILTTDMAHRYFNAINTKLHILGVASINRNIEKSSVKQKDGKIKTIGKIVDESRIITFRDDNFNIDSKSRFEDIVPSIPLDTDMFIEAINEAIRKEHDKQKDAPTIEESRIQQEKDKEIKINNYINSQKEIDVPRNEELIELIKTNIQSINQDEMVSILQAYKITDLKDSTIIKTEALEKIFELIK